MTDLNNTPNVTETVAADAPKHLHRRGGLLKARGVVKEWWWLRITAGLLVPLSVWFVVSLVTHLLGADTFVLQAWMNSPLVAIAMALLVALGFVHARLGVHEVMLDYIPSKGALRVALLLVDLVSIVLGGGALAAIYHLHMAA